MNQRGGDPFSGGKYGAALHTSTSPNFNGYNRNHDTFSTGLGRSKEVNKSIFRTQDSKMPHLPLPSTFGLLSASNEPQKTLNLQISDQSRTRLPQIATVIQQSGLNMPPQAYSPGMRGSFIQTRNRPVQSIKISNQAHTAQPSRQPSIERSKNLQFKKSAFEDNVLNFNFQPI